MERRIFEFISGINYRFGGLGSLVVFLCNINHDIKPFCGMLILR